MGAGFGPAVTKPMVLELWKSFTQPMASRQPVRRSARVLPLRFSVSCSHARLCLQERSSGPRSNARLANQTRCGSATSMSRTFSVSAPACPIIVATLAPPAAQYSRGEEEGEAFSIFESGAILQYLGRKIGKFYPQDE